MRLLVFLCLAFHSAAATYYVDATAGSDANDGLTTGTPWQTMTKVAATSFSSGDIIRLKRGETWLLTPSGTKSSGFTMPSSGITLTAYGTGELPILDGQGTCRFIVNCGTAQDTLTSFLHLYNGGPNGGNNTGANWVGSIGTNTIEDCWVRAHSVDACVDASDDAHIIVRRCRIEDAADDGITMHTTASCLIENCTITRCGQGINHSGSDMSMTVNDTAIYDNISSEVAPLSNCVSVFNRCRIQLRAGGTKLSDTGGASGYSTTWNYCIFDAQKATAVSGGEVTANDTQVFNNCVFFGTPTARSGTFSVATTATMTLNNCILSNWWRAASLTAPGTFTCNYCIIHNRSTGTITADNNSAGTADPLFVAPTNGDFRLQSGSAALNAGTNLSISLDRAGVAVANPPDIGAYEYFTRTATGTATSATVTSAKVAP